LRETCWEYLGDRVNPAAQNWDSRIVDSDETLLASSAALSAIGTEIKKKNRMIGRLFPDFDEILKCLECSKWLGARW
jgi:hypothetical protein